MTTHEDCACRIPKPPSLGYAVDGGSISVNGSPTRAYFSRWCRIMGFFKIYGQYFDYCVV
jgi:hypothetical protein